MFAMHAAGARSVALAFALLFGVATPALAQTTSSPAAVIAPGTRPDAERAVRELLAATAADSAARVAVLSRWLSAAACAAQGQATSRTLGRLAEQGGPFVLVRVEPVGRNTFATIRATRVPRLALLNLAWDRADSTRLRYVEVLKTWHPATDSIVWPATKLSERALAATIDRNVTRLAALGAYSGTVLVSHDGRTVLAKGYGLANRDDSVPNGVATRYMTASMGKMFTAVAIGQLIERGKLRLDDTLAKVLPDYPNAERARRITIRQLLGHRAGLGDVWSHPKWRARSYASNRDLAWTIAEGPTAFEPGTSWAYSNEGYIVLGAVIERLSGQTYEDYVREHIWRPAGMTEAAVAGTDTVLPHRAVGYQAGANDPLHVDALQPNWSFLGRTSHANGAGGTYASVRDFARFAEALRTDRLLGRAVRDTLWAGGTPLPWDRTTSYASGFERGTINGRTVLGHGGGGAAGIDNVMRFFPAEGWTVVVLGNLDPPAASDLGGKITSLVARQY